MSKTIRKIRVRAATIEGKDGPVDLFEGDQIPDDVSAKEVERLDAAGVLQPLDGDSSSSDGGEDLSKLKRPELEAKAIELGVAEPDKLPNKDAVIDAIKAAQA